MTPYFLGAVAGAIASGRVPPGIAEGDLFASWLNPTSTVTGLLAVGTAAYLAAVYLTRDAERAGEPALAEAFRRRALVTGAVVGVLSAVGLVVLRADSRALFDELTTGTGLPFVIGSVLAGLASLLLLRPPVVRGGAGDRRARGHRAAVGLGRRRSTRSCCPAST